jgi:hypothetical protein
MAVDLAKKIYFVKGMVHAIENIGCFYVFRYFFTVSAEPVNLLISTGAVFD